MILMSFLVLAAIVLVILIVLTPHLFLLPGLHSRTGDPLNTTVVIYRILEYQALSYCAVVGWSTGIEGTSFNTSHLQ